MHLNSKCTMHCLFIQINGTSVYAKEFPPASSLWMRSAKFGSSPHQKSQSSLRPCCWHLLHTLSISAFRQRLKLHRMGSSSVTGKRIGAEVGPCHTNLFHLIPVKSACKTGERGGGERETVSVQSRCFGTHSAPLRKHVVSRVLRVSINPLLWGFSPLNYPDNTPCCRDWEGENISLQTQTRNSRKQSGTFDCFCKRSCT